MAHHKIIFDWVEGEDGELENNILEKLNALDYKAGDTIEAIPGEIVPDPAALTYLVTKVSALAEDKDEHLIKSTANKEIEFVFIGRD